MSFGYNKNHIVRAALESIPYQIKDVIECNGKRRGHEIKRVNDRWRHDLQSICHAILNRSARRNVVSIGMPDVSALGAAYLAGLKAGVYRSMEQLKTFYSEKFILQPLSEQSQVKTWYRGWQKSLNDRK